MSFCDEIVSKCNFVQGTASSAQCVHVPEDGEYNADGKMYAPSTTPNKPSLRIVDISTARYTASARVLRC